MGKVTEHQTSVTADVVTRTTKGRWSDVGVGAGRRADGLTEDDENEADRPTERTNEGRQSALRAALVLTLVSATIHLSTPGGTPDAHPRCVCNYNL